ncbi:MAG: hypothetical protein K2P87_06300 [Lachnospiraceae bacterium]|nr:hypothetical protein [Lachnospiraceae bacterium]
MAITPIETAAFLPKSQEASFQRQNDVQRPANEQAVLHNDQQQRAMADANRPVMMAKTDQPEYRYDGSSGNGKGMLYKKKNPKKEKKREHEGGDRMHSGFDMRI